jgi:hypothetical protein
MATVAFGLPILPGKTEAWRRFVQELHGCRRPDYIESRRRLGINREGFWLTHACCGDVVVTLVDADAPAQLFARLAASVHPFDRWYQRQLLELHGLDLTRPGARLLAEPIAAWEGF